MLTYPSTPRLSYSTSVHYKMEGRLRRKRPRTDATCRQLNKKQHSQKQPNYEPPEGHTMSKDELSSWRKNQRRLRNRQSAAASRQKQKDRIEELEAEVESLKTRLKFYEKSFPLSTSTSVQPPQAPLPPPPTYLTRQRSVPISPPNSPTLSYISSQNQLNKPKRSAVP